MFLTTPMFSFGVLSDVQYADIPDGLNFAQTKMRRYRQSLECLREATASWQNVDFCVALGDLLDGQAASHKWEALSSAREAMGDRDWHVAVGNHDLACFTRDELRKEFGRLYYDWRPAPGFICCVLDAYALSVVRDQRAARVLAANNPNILAEDPTRPSDQLDRGWFDGLSQDEYRWLPYNGAFDADQLAWFKGVLARAKQSGDKVFAFSHAPVYAPAAKPTNCAWDADAILRAADDAPGVLVAWFAGHDHDGGYARRNPDEHHLTPAAPIECDVGQVSYGTVDVYPDRAELRWVGKRPSSAWPEVIHF